MKLAMFQDDGAARPGIVLGEKIIDLNAGMQIFPKQTKRRGKVLPINDLKTFITMGPSARRLAGQVEALIKNAIKGEKRVPPAFRKCIFALKKVKLLPPISNPPKIICLAMNYASHIREVDGDDSAPKRLVIFMKPSTAIIGPEDAIVIPPECEKLDHEVELAVVIGKKGRYIPEEKSMDHVAGYTIFNDISDREYVGQKGAQRMNWFLIKAQDTFAPMGPYLVLKDEIKGPQSLRLRLWVNGELRQDGTGEDMIFKIPEIISRTSYFVTLEPGDIIATGTPAGTSFSTQKYLKNGNRVECQIEGIGRLRNFVKVKKAVYSTK